MSNILCPTMHVSSSTPIPLKQIRDTARHLSVFTATTNHFEFIKSEADQIKSFILENLKY